LKLHWPVFGCQVHNVIHTGLGFLGFGSSQHTPTPNYQWTQLQNHKHYDEQMKLFFLINKNQILYPMNWIFILHFCFAQLLQNNLTKWIISNVNNNYYVEPLQFFVGEWNISFMWIILLLFGVSFGVQTQVCWFVTMLENANPSVLICDNAWKKIKCLGCWSW